MFRSLSTLFFISFLLSISHFGYTQCTGFVNGPFPLPEYNNYNCINGICDQPQELPVQWQPGDAWLLQLPPMLPNTQYVINFGLDPGVLPFAGNLEITVFDPFLNVVIATGPGLELTFTLPPAAGDYLISISELGNCGQPPTIGPFFGILIDALCPLNCPMDRVTAVNTLLADPDLVFDPNTGLLMCPFVDYGAGPGFEGMLPPSTAFDPAIDLISGVPPSPTFTVNPSYLFYLDPFPGLRFEHDVMYFTVDALHPSPTIANGGIQVYLADWWPYVEPPGATGPTELFGTIDLYYTNDPVGALNTAGICAGLTFSISFNGLYTDCDTLVDKNNNKCALIFSGEDENRLKNSVKRAKERINMRECYDKDNIIVVENATEKQVCDTLDHILNKNPKCEELCIHVTAHGRKSGGIVVNGGVITPKEWKAKMDSISKKEIVTHITLETCHSTALGNPFTWNLPKGSSVVYAAEAGQCSWSYTYKTPDCDTINEDIFSHAIETCRKDTANADLDKDKKVSYKEGVQWVLKSKPCYSKIDGSGKMRYPAGSSTDTTAYNPKPGFVCIGEHASSLSRRYKMPDTTACKVCIVVKGNRTQGVSLVYTGNGTFSLSHTTTKTYNADKDETTICFFPPSGFKFVKNTHYWFHWFDNTGKKMNVLRAYTEHGALILGAPESNAAIMQIPLPTTDVQATLSLDGSQLMVSIFNRGVIGDGHGEELTLQNIGYRISNDSVPFALLNNGHPEYTNLPLIAVDTNVMLDTNTAYTFALDIPADIIPGQYLLVEVDHTWGANSSETRSIDQFSATGTRICLGDITYTAMDTIPDITNSSGVITLDGPTVNNLKSVFNAGMEINLLPGTEIPLGKESILYILGCLQGQ